MSKSGAFRLLQSSQNIFSDQNSTSSKLKIYLPLATSYGFTFFCLPLLAKSVSEVPEIEVTTFTFPYFDVSPEYIRSLIKNMEIIVLDNSYERYLDNEIWKKYAQLEQTIKLFSAKSYLDQAPALQTQGKRI
ncbi:hypothetical protein [Facilibium subflavum]|uniref:hypothetical protein n=1 Tax=Facilibium subflavum TaxID=2219058 RepID=UPI000E6576C2|nr:hypothetical protein [Facilibium subflavum]